MNRIVLLTDYRGWFYHSSKHSFKDGSMDIGKIKKFFEKKGYDLEVLNFCEVNFNEDYRGCKIIYQSSEDIGLYYKSFIEDILLGLQLKGAILIPDFLKFRAHHNKVFMEILRKVSSLSEINNLNTRFFGTWEEYKKYFMDKEKEDKHVIFKLSFGCASNGVKKLKIKDVVRIKKMIGVRNFLYDFKGWLKARLFKDYKPISLYRRKFIVQDFVPGLKCDFKVLVYWDKIFVVRRMVKEGDFRASGSGLIEYSPDVIADGLLDYAYNIRDHFKVPFISLDIAITNDTFYLLEFQFIAFGNVTVEKASHCWVKSGDKWEKRQGEFDVEEEFVYSICSFIESTNNKNL